jgi:tRNA pseudouridine55 synthase
MSRRRPSRFHGLLPIFKRAGPTSHDVVDMARKALRERRIGHTGTLDPMAEGLLLLCVGRATRLQQFLLLWDKAYQGEVKLGHATTTYDSEGEAQEPAQNPPDLDDATLDELAARFQGTIEQVPPPYSAKKIAGKKLYELARSGEKVSPEPKTVVVHDLHLEVSAPDLLSVEIRTSSGFYVRSLAHDIGRALGCGGHLHHLHRSAIGPYAAEQALSQEQLQAAESSEDVIGSDAWIPLEHVALPFPEIDLNSTAAERFVHGQEVVVFRSASTELEKDARVVVRGAGNRLLGIGSVRSILARGRTLNIAPTMVLDTSTGVSASPRDHAGKLPESPHPGTVRKPPRHRRKRKRENEPL